MNDNVIMYMKNKTDRIKNDPICSYLNRLFVDQVPIGINQKREVIWGKDNAIQEPTAELNREFPEVLMNEKDAFLE